MTDSLHERTIAENLAWWAAHPDFKAPTTGTADSLARSVVHWQHNVESRRRHEDWSKVANDEFFRRRYALAATQAWLVEAQAKLDALGSTTPETWYQKRDLEVEIRTLQGALDDFEWNSRDQQGGS